MAEVRVEDLIEPFQRQIVDEEHFDRPLLMSHLCTYRLAGAMGRGRRVLEIGCGMGYGAYYLAHVAASVSAVDLDATLVQQAERLFVRPNLAFQCMDGTALAFAPGCFDLVASSQLIEHIPERQLLDFVRGIDRVLGRDGLAVISTPNVDHQRKDVATYQKCGVHEHEFIRGELLALLQEVFPQVQVFGLFPRWHYQVCRRLKKWGLERWGPASWNPVRRFLLERLDTSDHCLRGSGDREAIDLIALCAKADAPRWSRQAMASLLA